MPRVWDVPVRDSTRVRDARVAAEDAAALAGLDERRTAAAALVATELATNLLKHAEGGQVLIEVVAPPALREGREESRLVQIAAIDHGPGISDVPAALRDGFSTTRSLGAGLGTCLRLADDFGLHSTPGHGTVAVARVGATPRGGDGPAGPAVRVWADGVSGSWGDMPGPGAFGDALPEGSEGGASGGAWWPDGASWAAESPVGAVACGELTGHAAASGGAPGFAGQAGRGPRDSGVLGNEPWSQPVSGVPDGEVRGPGTAGREGRPGPSGDRSVPVADVRAGGVNIPYAGAEYSGDAWAWVRAGDRVTLMLADGLGHGPEAARASSAAISALHRWAHLSPAEALRQLHEALKGTRGAAVALAQLDLRAERLRFAGIGNVGARLRTDGTWRHLLSRPGIVGVHRPTTLREDEADWADDRLLILHTDGLPSRWTPPSHAGLLAADPAVTAAVTIRDASSPARPVRDDTAVAVLTSTSPERP
jgi:anti-sigma regulatory factor (Ser/Thr protein kinase)